MGCGGYTNLLVLERRQISGQDCGYKERGVADGYSKACHYCWMIYNMENI